MDLSKNWIYHSCFSSLTQCWNFSFENGSEHARNGLGTTTKNNNNIRKFVFAAIRQCEVDSLLVLLVIAFFAVTDFFPQYCGAYVFLSSGLAFVITCGLLR